MPEVSDAVATPDRIDFTYKVAAGKLASELDTVDTLDAELGVLVDGSGMPSGWHVPG